MITAQWRPYRLIFKETAITSRASMTYKDTYILHLRDSDTGREGWGECALFAGLSHEDSPSYTQWLDRLCADPESGADDMPSSVRFGYETAMRDLRSPDGITLFPGSDWATSGRGIPINGLIWMGDKDTMARRIRQKLDDGFRCLKLKIGGIDFDDETDLLRHIRSRFPADTLELRLDANGSFTTANALQRLDTLARYGIHSIEQPIRAGQYDDMARICRESPIPVALDEELILPNTTPDFKRRLLADLAPAYIILKPSLCGGFAGADQWISAACAARIGWWATSALESNIGLNAIAQWVDTYRPTMVQGLGTGQLYTNNIPSPLVQRGAAIYYDLPRI